jgi:hypothetical protein
MAMFPRHFTDPVPPAGIKTQSGAGAAGCFLWSQDYDGGDTQVRYRSHKLGEAGERLHTPGILNREIPHTIVFGAKSGEKNGSVGGLLHEEPKHDTQARQALLNASEAEYQRSKQRLGQTPVGVADIPGALKTRGFGIETRMGETVGEVVQRSRCDVPRDPRMHTGYQTRRNYDWNRSGLDPVTHTFGIKGESGMDHVTRELNYGNDTSIVVTAVDRADHNAILPDPDPLDPVPGIVQHTMRADQLRDLAEPSSRAPAGVVTRTSEFTIGDTFAGMGLMTSVDVEHTTKPRGISAADDIVHGIRTMPNPFPNPLRGPGKYVNLGLSDEDFMKLRDRFHILPVMVEALGLSEEEATEIYDQVARDQGRDLISVLEFHEEFKKRWLVDE